MAALAVQDSRLPDAALLVSAADRAMAESGAVQVPADVRLRERRVGKALASLDASVREEMYEAGARLELTEALDHATEQLLGR